MYVFFLNVILIKVNMCIDRSASTYIKRYTKAYIYTGRGGRIGESTGLTFRDGGFKPLSSQSNDV